MDSIAFKNWLSGSGYGSGDGSGSGDGYGDGDGYGSGDGYGYGSGDGDGYGSGDGYGYGSGSGDGYGYGDGYGSGDGYGYGSGDGDGYGDGYGYGDGFKLLKHKGQAVFYVDGIPCIPRQIKAEIARVEVIGKDMRLTPMFIAKGHGLFAHGKTIREAVNALEVKRVSEMDFEEKKQEFRDTFKPKKKYPARDFFIWHGILTGSCESGRQHFVSERGIDLDNDTMTVNEFFETVENAYGHERIREVKGQE